MDKETYVLKTYVSFLLFFFCIICYNVYIRDRRIRHGSPKSGYWEVSEKYVEE